jgi:CDGSH-type Zn-finger protein
MHETQPYGKPGFMGAKDAVRITPYRDGPLLVRGPFDLIDAGGAAIDSQRSIVALCRCGKSRMRPFCDGTHKLTGFTAAAGIERAASGSRAD